MRKVVLAYSGGLDTSVAIKWLKENYCEEVIAVTVDVGQNSDLEFIYAYLCYRSFIPNNWYLTRNFLEYLTGCNSLGYNHYRFHDGWAMMSSGLYCNRFFGISPDENVVLSIVECYKYLYNVADTDSGKFADPFFIDFLNSVGYGSGAEAITIDKDDDAISFDLKYTSEYVRCYGLPSYGIGVKHGDYGLEEIAKHVTVSDRKGYGIGIYGIGRFSQKYLVYIKVDNNVSVMLLKLPVIGTFLQKVIIARFARLFYTMNRTGVNITETLEIIQKSIGNMFYAKVIEKLYDSILKGESLAEGMRKTGQFPELLIDMVLIGEKSGSLDDMLLSVSNFYEEEVSEMVENMSSLIEPIITVVLGGMVLLLALALFLPMWEMMNIM